MEMEETKSLQSTGLLSLSIKYISYEKPEINGAVREAIDWIAWSGMIHIGLWSTVHDELFLKTLARI